MESKLFEHTTIKVNGVRFTIRKLSPSLFMDKDYLLPMATAVEKSNTKSGAPLTDEEMLKGVEEFKDKMQDVISKAVIYVKTGFFSKKESIFSVLDKIMEYPEIYSYLFTIIVNHSLGLKKKHFSHLHKSIKITPKLFTK